jgi:hypothetical protein
MLVGMKIVTLGETAWHVLKMAQESEWHSRGHRFDPGQLHQLRQQLSRTPNPLNGGFVYFLSILGGIS